MIRFPTESDRGEIMRMCEEFHKASPYCSLDFNPDKCGQIFDQFLASDKRDLLILLAESDGVFGMIIGLRGELPFSSSTVCTELAWWVDRDRRGSRESLELLYAYEEWSRRVGSEMTQVAMLDDVSDLSRFYTRMGYTPSERSYIKET